jgi:hypothetical protein
MSEYDAVDGSSSGTSRCHNAENEEPQERSYPMDQVCTIGLDIAKNVFQVHGIDETGAVVSCRWPPGWVDVAVRLLVRTPR